MISQMPSATLNGSQNRTKNQESGEGTARDGRVDKNRGSEKKMGEEQSGSLVYMYEVIK